MLADLRTYILAGGAVSALIGSRFYPHKLPQSPTLPAVTYQVISELRGHVMSGADGTPGTRVQIDAWASTMADALAVADAIRARLDGYAGTLAGSTKAQGVFADQSQSLYEPDAELHRVTRDFIIYHEES